VKLLIQHGRVLDPVNRIDRLAQVCIADGVVVAVGAIPQGFVADRVLDATGKLVLPGLVDLAARLSPSSVPTNATIPAEIQAAFAGGVTSVVVPPDTVPVLDTVARVQSLLRQSHGLRLHPLGAMTPGLNGRAFTEMVALKQAGCVAFSQGLVPVQDTSVLLRALQYAKTFDYAMWFRPQDFWLSQGGVIASGAYATRLGLQGIPAEAETIGLHTLLALQRATGVRMHFCRLSCLESVAIVRSAKKEGLPVTCDVAANNLHLTDVDIGFYDSHFRLDPPLRGQRDRDALRGGLLDGTIDAVCSDHIALSDRDKDLPFAQAVPGSIGLELLLSLTLKWAQEARIDWVDAFSRVTCGPAKILGAQAGSLSVGESADLCLVDPEAYWLVGRDTLVGESVHTPFLGRELPGRVQTTVLRGEIVWERTT
jgi:dihydroorotase